MRENKFENQVRERLDDWHLSPSDGVWPQVEARIRRRRRRWMAAVLIPLLGLMIAGGTYFTFFRPSNDINHSTGTATNIPAQSGTSSQSVEKETIVAPDHSLTNETTIQETAKSTPDNSNDKLKHADKIFGHPDVAVSTQPGGNPSEGKSIDRSNADIAIAPASTAGAKAAGTEVLKQGENNTTTPLISESATARPSANIPEVSASDQTPTVFEKSSVKPSQYSSRSDYLLNTRVELLAVNLANASVLKNNRLSSPVLPALSRAAVRFPGKKFHWGVTAELGTAVFSRHTFGDGIQNKSRSLADYNVSSAPLYSNGFVYRGPSWQHTEAVRSSPGLSYRIGGLAGRDFGKRFTITAGLGYQFVSEHLRVGNNDNSSSIANFSIVNTSAYYRGNDATSFTNKYHFLEIPLQLEFTAARLGNWKLQLTTGGSYARLLKSNTLTYENTSNGYYASNPARLSKDHLNVMAGFQFYHSFRNGSGFAVGPQYRVGLMDMRPDSYDLNRYLQSGSLQFRYFVK